MIPAIGLLILSSAGNLQAASNGELSDAWLSYRHAEFNARGGYNCDRRQQRLIASAFDRRFGKRVAVVKNVVVERLGKAEAEAGFDVVAICEKFKPAVFADPSWPRTYFDTFEAALLRVEATFGVRGSER